MSENDTESSMLAGTRTGYERALSQEGNQINEAPNKYRSKRGGGLSYLDMNFVYIVCNGNVVIVRTHRARSNSK